MGEIVDRIGTRRIQSFPRAFSIARKFVRAVSVFGWPAARLVSPIANECLALLKISVSQLDAEARRVKFGERGRARAMYKGEHLTEHTEKREG